MSFDFQMMGHEKIELLNKTLDEAQRDIENTDKQKKISAILVFANHVEYLTRDILKNLMRMIKISAYQRFNGSIFWPDPETNLGNYPLGRLIELLRCFSFPDKSQFLKHLSNFNEMRIKFIHRLLEEAPIDENVARLIKENFNNIFDRYKIIRKEIEDKWPEQD